MGNICKGVDLGYLKYFCVSEKVKPKFYSLSCLAGHTPSKASVAPLPVTLYEIQGIILSIIHWKSW